MAEEMGGPSLLPTLDRQPDRDAFLSEVLAGWRRSQITTSYTLSSPDYAARELERVPDKDLPASKGTVLMKPRAPPGKASR